METFFVEPLGQDWVKSEWEEKTFGGKYRKNQLAQHKEISEKIFDLVVEHKDTDNPLANFLILLNNDKSWYRSRKFAGRMSDLTEEQIQELRKEFFIYHDNSGYIRCEIEPEPGKSWGYVKQESTIPSIYIVQGTHPNRYNRHDVVHWDFPRDIDTPICKTREEFKAIERELFIHGFGNYEDWKSDDGSVTWHYKLYDHSDEEFTQFDKVKFIRIFEHVSVEKNNIPLLFLLEEKEDRGEMVRTLDVDNGFSFGRGVLGHELSSGAEPNLNKVPQELIDEHLKIVFRIPVTKYKGKTMNLGEGKIVSMEKKGEYVFIDGIDEQQKKILKDRIDYYKKEGGSYDMDMETLLFIEKELGYVTPPKEKMTEEDDRANNMLWNIARMIQQNPPQSPEEWDEFMTDLKKQPDSRKKRYIETRANQKIYHDFESPLAGPKMALIEDLQAAGYDEMVKKAIEGYYDF